MPQIEPTREPGVSKIVGAYKTTYRVVVDIGPDPSTGKRRQRTKTFDRYQDAVDWKTRVRHERREQSYVEPSEEPLGVFVDRWLATLSRPGPATRVRYRHYIEGQIKPHLGAVALGDLRPEQIDGWTATLARSGLAAHTVHDAFGLLNMALKAAVRWRLIAANPAALAVAPRIPKRPPTIWNADQIKQFLAAVAEDPLFPAWQLALLLGVRRGELLALRWADVDLERASVTIRRSMTRDDQAHWVVGSPKTEASHRVISLPASIVGSLRVHHYRQAERRDLLEDAWHEEGLVFERGDGRPVEQSTFHHRFHRLRETAGLPRIRPHDMRHSAASYMLTEVKLPLIVVSRILGHSHIGTTADTYGHVDDSALRNAAERIERLLAGSGGELL